MNLVAAHGAESGKNHGILDLLLIDHLLEAGQKIGAEFEAQHDDALEMSADGKDIGHVGTVGFGIDGGIARGVSYFAARLLRRQGKA